jgi:hypothetical protein
VGFVVGKVTLEQGLPLLGNTVSRFHTHITSTSGKTGLFQATVWRPLCQPSPTTKTKLKLVSVGFLDYVRLVQVSLIVNEARYFMQIAPRGSCCFRFLIAGTWFIIGLILEKHNINNTTYKDILCCSWEVECHEHPYIENLEKQCSTRTMHWSHFEQKCVTNMVSLCFRSLPTLQI